MSQPTIRSAPLPGLRPGFFEFTGTKGVLRVLRPKENLTRAQGILFSCPRCSRDKEKAHFNIFIFDFPDIPPEVKPKGRFCPRMVPPDSGTGAWIPAPFHLMTLQNLNVKAEADLNHLAPDGVTCGWSGTLKDGIVTWKLNLAERWFS